MKACKFSKLLGRFKREDGRFVQYRTKFQEVKTLRRLVLQSLLTTTKSIIRQIDESCSHTEWFEIDTRAESTGNVHSARVVRHGSLYCSFS